jgi:peptidoglycan/LPS O-acetylase OafA/YrhL
MAMALAAALGSAVRARPDRLEAGLAGAAVLSVLASPHALPHDLALLVPPAAWCFAALAARRSRPAALLKAAILVWIALSAAAAADTVLDGQVPPGPLTPWVLIAAAALAVAVAVRAPTREPARPAPGSPPKASPAAGP